MIWKSPAQKILRHKIYFKILTRNHQLEYKRSLYHTGNQTPKLDSCPERTPSIVPSSSFGLRRIFYDWSSENCISRREIPWCGSNHDSFSVGNISLWNVPEIDIGVFFSIEFKIMITSGVKFQDYYRLFKTDKRKSNESFSLKGFPSVRQSLTENLKNTSIQ